MNRRNAREAALCMIFDYSFHSDEKADELLDLYIDNFQDDKERCISEELRTDSYFTKVYFGVISNIPAIDKIIVKCSKKWSVSRISRVAMSIMRLALYEIFFMEDIPTQVSINEAVELAKKFDSDDSYTFINGILGAAVKLSDEERKAIIEEKSEEEEQAAEEAQNSEEAPASDEASDETSAEKNSCEQ